MKRVVTAVGPDGRSHVVLEGQPGRVLRLRQLPGLTFEEVWATESTANLSDPAKDITPGLASLVPAAQGSRFRIVTLPPDAEVARVLSNPADAFEMIGEFRAQAPGIADAGELHDPAMHATPTLDYGVILSGEVEIELDSGEAVTMRAGDCVVQLGAKHAWRNKSNAACQIAFVMLGTIENRETF